MRTLIIICAILISINSYGQSADTNTFNIQMFKKMAYNLNFENKCKRRKAIKRKSKDEVIFLFFQDRSDTVRIYVNDKLVFNKFIIHDSDLVSTNYTGVDFSNYYQDEVNTVRIVYLKTKAYIEFPLDKKFPLYGIYFLKNDTFYVSGRKCIMVIK